MSSEMPNFRSEDLFLSRPKFVMKFFGVWVPPENESLPRKLRKLFMLILQYLFLIFQTIYILQIWGDLEAVSQPSYLLFTQACLCLKITVFHVNVDNLRELLKQMASDIFVPQSPVQEKILEIQATRIKRFLLGFLIGAELVCVLWVMHPMLTGVRKFPFDMWMPVSPSYSPHYEIGYAFQFLTICMSAFMYFGVDSVALSLVMFGCGQIEIIKDKILSISPVQHGLKENERKMIYDKNHKILVECVIHHQAVVTFAQLVEDTFHWYLLFQLTGDVGVTCMCALRMLVEEVRSLPFASIIIYVVTMMTQLFICCWSGHELTATTEDLQTALYECIWYEQDLKFKKDLRFVMLRMSRPIVFRAGHYISMSRQTFVAEPPNSVQFLSTLNYLVTMLAQLYLYCWCGNKLTDKSQALRDALYMSSWHTQDRRFRRALEIAMECMKRPIIFRAGYYIPLSRPTFVSIPMFLFLFRCMEQCQQQINKMFSPKVFNIFRK